METKKFEIDWQGKKGEVVIRRMGFGEKMDFLEQISETRMVGKMASIVMHPWKLRALALMGCLVKAPFPVENNYIHKELDPDTGSKIYEEIEKFNKLDFDVKKKLNGPSKEQPPTPS